VYFFFWCLQGAHAVLFIIVVIALSASSFSYRVAGATNNASFPFFFISFQLGFLPLIVKEMEKLGLGFSDLGFYISKNIYF